MRGRKGIPTRSEHAQPRLDGLDQADDVRGRAEAEDEAVAGVLRPGRRGGENLY